MSLNNKSALVCGGSKGIGRASAIELADRGASVTLVARSESALEETLSELATSDGQSHHALVADFTDPHGLQSIVADHAKENGPIHILVNNTGGPPAGPILSAPEEQLRQAFSNHIICSQLLVQTLVEGMKKANYGRIINIISTSVIQPIKGLGVSNTIRGATANWARTLAGELAPFGITVNNVLPGFTATDRLQSIFKGKAERTGTALDEIERQALQTIPMGRLGKPEELGAVVAFLASPEASYVTGVNLPVDGGRTAVQ